MANARKQVTENVAGEFYVDLTCIDCEACQQLAPEVFAEAGSYSYVHTQPGTAGQRRAALRALVACPVGSIGTLGLNDAKAVMADFPLPVEEPVYYCGFNSPRSYGANSYFIRHPDGNWLVDSPKFLPQLVRRFEAMGGVARIFLTHRDDVADASRYARHFGSRRIIHRDDLAAEPDAEIVIEGRKPVAIADGFRIIPTPGHTRGHCVLLAAGRYLFTGDHLRWDPAIGGLGASRSVCWYSWPEQTESMRRLLDETFQWVLPGHGDRHHLPAAPMRQALTALIATMEH